MKTLRPLLATLNESWHLLLIWGIVFAVGAQLLQLILLILRFGDLPNYAISYDWLSNALLIVQSTPSMRDMLPIIFEEWWIEIGFMNFDYGNGISEWSLNIIPSRLVMLGVMGSMFTTLVLLIRGVSFRHPATTTASAAAGLGTLLMCMTSAAMSWVVCCATPSWVVGLAMLGLGVSTSLALEQLGPTLFSAGFLLLTLSLVLVSRLVAKTQIRDSSGSHAHVSIPDRQFQTISRRV